MKQIEGQIIEPMKEAEQLPQVKLTLKVPAETIVSYLHSRSEDSRIKSTSKLLLDVHSLREKAGQPESSVKNIDQETIEETTTCYEWYGQIHIRYCYSIHPLNKSSTELSIATQYRFPWLLRSLISWPNGNMMRSVLVVSVEALVAELVALETGRLSADTMRSTMPENH